MSDDIKAKLKRARRRQATEEVCLRGDLAGEFEQLEVQLEALPKSNKLAGDPERTRLQEAMDRVRADMQADTVPFTLRALPDTPYQELVDAHPPRRDGDEVNASDARWGFNWSTFPRALIRACTVEPVLDDEDWALLFGEDVGLSPGQLARLREVALTVNGRSVDVPFSPAASNGNSG